MLRSNGTFLLLSLSLSLHISPSFSLSFFSPSCTALFEKLFLVIRNNGGLVSFFHCMYHFFLNKFFWMNFDDCLHLNNFLRKLASMCNLIPGQYHYLCEKKKKTKKKLHLFHTALKNIFGKYP